MGVIIPGDFKVVRIKRYFTLNVFVLTRFHCITVTMIMALLSALRWQTPDSKNSSENITKSSKALAVEMKCLRRCY